MAPVHDAKNNLILAMYDPNLELYSDEFIAIIADLYPKSRYHYLVLPKENIQDVRALLALHIPKLIYMELKGLEYVMRKTGLSADNFL